jgi:hypothetical protein
LEWSLFRGRLMAGASDYPINLTKIEDLTSVKEVANGEDDAYRWVDITYRNGWVLRVSIYKNVFLVDHPYDLRLTDGRGNLVKGVLDPNAGRWGTLADGLIEGTDLDTVSYCIAGIAVWQDQKKKERFDIPWFALLSFLGVMAGLAGGSIIVSNISLVLMIASLILSYKH